MNYNLKVIDSLFYRIKLTPDLIIIPDMSKQVEYLSYGLPQKKMYKSLLMYPLCVNGQLRGVLVAYAEEVNQFAKVDQHILSILAGLTTMTLRFFFDINNKKNLKE